MAVDKSLRVTLVATLCFGLSSCGGFGFGNNSNNLNVDDRMGTEALPGDGGFSRNPEAHNRETAPMAYDRSSIWDVFGGDKGDRTVSVNRYLWAASLDVLNFLPIQSVDPFTGVIVTGYGTPPGGGRSYRATVHIKDPALDARSLTVSLQTKGGPVSAGTIRAVEDAILARARQMRIGDDKL